MEQMFQGMLMVGTILGPGTIFLMMVGALVSVFSIDIWTSFLWNFLPILAFMGICYFCKQKYQVWWFWGWKYSGHSKLSFHRKLANRSICHQFCIFPGNDGRYDWYYDSSEGRRNLITVLAVLFHCCWTDHNNR